MGAASCEDEELEFKLVFGEEKEAPPLGAGGAGEGQCGAGKGSGLHMPPLPGRRPSPGEVRRAIVRGTQDVSSTRWPSAV